MAVDINTNQVWIKHRNYILLAVGIGTFMSALDGSVANTILPIIRQDFNSTVSAVEWAVIVYLVVVSGLLLSFGRLGDLIGHKPIYLAGYGLFVSGSILCGLAQNPTILSVFRGLQAIGGAMLMSNSPAILTQTFPPQQRGRVLGLQGTMTYLGLMTGPALGGFLAQVFSWRLVFFINVPVGLAGLTLSALFISSIRSDIQKERFDIPGSLLFLFGLSTLMLALNEGSSWGWLSLLTISLLAVSIAGMIGFVYLELRTVEPMLDMSLFKDRLFSSGAGAAVLNYMAMYSITFLLPFYLIQGRGFSPAAAGLILTAQPLMMAIITPISGTLSDKIGTRLPATLGMAILAIGTFMLAWINGNSSSFYLAVSLAIVGIGVGMFVSPNNSAIMGSAPRRRQGIAAGVLATARNVGMVLGVGLSGAVLTTLTSSSDPSLSLVDSQLIFNAMHAGFLLATGIAVVGIVFSASRGKPAPVSI